MGECIYKATDREFKLKYKTYIIVKRTNIEA